MTVTHLRKIIYRPLETAKALAGERSNTHAKVFAVAPWANKVQITDALETLFTGIKVAKVRTLIVKGTQRVFRGRVGKTKSWKKAYVLLKEGFELNFNP
jgi:large subunit ribosomal protein L23